MIIHTTKLDESVQVQIRAVGDLGQIGDLTVLIKPGESFLHHPYEWWAMIENGRHEALWGKHGPEISR